MSPKVTSSENIPDNSVLQSFTVCQLLPSTMPTMEKAGTRIHSPYPTLIAVLKGNACLTPGDLNISKGQVLLNPPTYPCTIKPEKDCQVELAAIDFSFRFQGMDVSGALPTAPIIISKNSADLLTKEICTICNSTAATPDISQTTERLAAGYRIANTLSVLLEWDKNPVFSLNEDEELQALTTYLEANCHLPLTIEDIAADCNLSRRKAFIIASRHSCGTPMRILKQIRLERSLDYLRRDDTTISEAATKVGFNDAKNFSREFKKCYGMTPAQYKQQSQLGLQAESLVNKADAKMQENLSKRAADLYLQAINCAPQSSDLNALYYKAGLALKKAGDNKKSSEIWGKVTSLNYRLLINLDICEYLNRSSECEQIIKKLKHVYDHGDSKLRRRAVDQLSKLMLECISGQKQRAAKEYTLLAKELVKDRSELQPNLARTLYSTGQFSDIERYCPEQRFFIAAALRAMGLYEEHLERFPEMRTQCAMLHLRMRNDNEVLSQYEDQPGLCVKALVDSGRTEEAVSRYPEHNILALMVQGKFEEVLERHPDELQMCVFALANLGREAEALEVASSSADLTARLLFSMERPHEITSSPSRDFTLHIVRAATVLQGIHALEKDDLQYGLEILDSVVSITDPDYRRGHEYYEVDLIVMLIQHLLRNVPGKPSQSKWPALNAHLHDIVENWRYCYDQRLWYDARYILAEIDEVEYFLQPYRRDADSRLALAQAIKAELKDNHTPEELIGNYRKYLETLPKIRYSYEGGATPVLKAYIRWRLNILTS